MAGRPALWRRKRRDKRGRSPTIMDTMFYASIATLLESIAQNNRRSVFPEPEFPHLDLSYISR